MKKRCNFYLCLLSVLLHAGTTSASEKPSTASNGWYTKLGHEVAFSASCVAVTLPFLTKNTINNSLSHLTNMAGVVGLCGVGYYAWKLKKSYRPNSSGTTKPKATAARAPLGMANLGNTCYLNAMMQVILSAKEAMEYLAQQQPSKSNLFNALASYTAAHLSSDRSRVLHENQRFQAILIARKVITPGNQDDPNCFFTLLTARLGDDVTGGLVEEAVIKPLRTFFAQRTQQILRCNESDNKTQCSFKSETHNTPANTLQLSCYQQQTSLTMLLDKHFGRETVEGHKHTNENQVEVQHAIWKGNKLNLFPQYLLIAVKALQLQGRIQSLQAPLHLSMSTYSALTQAQTPSYKLQGLVCHSGDAEGGHYTALVKRQDAWFYCNDNSVYSVNGNQVQTWLTRGRIDNNFIPTIFLYERQDLT